MKKIGLTVLASITIIQAQAALPPLYQTSKEIMMMMQDSQLGEKLQSGEVIEKIEKNKDGYEIVTNKSHLQVTILYELAKQPGPVNFKLHFGDRIPLSFQ